MIGLICTLGISFCFANGQDRFICHRLGRTSQTDCFHRNQYEGPKTVLQAVSKVQCPLETRFTQFFQKVQQVRPTSKTSAAIFLAGLCCCACQRSGTEDVHQSTISEKTREVVQKVSAGHAKMLSILERIKDRSSEEHPYFGLGQDRKLRQMLAKIVPGSNNLRRFQIFSRLGLNELLCEETPQLAIEYLTQAHDLLE